MILSTLLLGCTQTVRFPPDRFPTDEFETGFFETGVGPAGGRIDDLSIQFDCADSNELLSASFTVDGGLVTGSIRIAHGANGRVETHPMNRTNPNDTRRLQLQLTPTGVTDDAFLPGINTGFTCATDRQWLSIGAWTRNNVGATTDCVIWGPDPEIARNALRAEIGATADTCRYLGINP